MAGFVNSLMTRLVSRFGPYGTAYLAATLFAALVLALDPLLRPTYFGLASPRQLLLGMAVSKQFRPGRPVVTSLIVSFLLQLSCARAFDLKHGTQLAIVLVWTIVLLPSIFEGWIYGQTVDYDFEDQLAVWVIMLFAFSFNSAGWIWREDVDNYVSSSKGGPVFLLAAAVLVVLQLCSSLITTLIILVTYGPMYLVSRLFRYCLAAAGDRLAAWESQVILHLHGDNSENARFAHDSLRPGHIRLLRLHRRRLFQPIKLDVAQFSLDNAPPYEALSYRWDDSSPKELVLVSHGVAEVMQPIHQFFMYRRSWWTGTWVWIDSLCIDQSPGRGDKEKESQIPLMGTIFSKAIRVIAWLGGATRSQVAYRTILYLAKQYTAFHADPDAIAAKVENMSDWQWQQLADFFANSYLRRVWIFQEVVLAKTLHFVFDGVCIEGDTILRVANIVKHPNLEGFLHPSVGQHRDAALGVIDASTMLANRNRTLRIFDLNEVLESTVPMQVSKAHDKVYGILGMVDQERHKDLSAPRYDLSVEEVYRSAMIHVLSTTKSLHLLHLAGLGKQQDRRLPSWVPDLAQQNIQALHVGTKPKYHAGIRLKPVIDFPGSYATWIQVGGNQVDRVVEVVPSGLETESSRTGTEKLFELLSGWMKEVDCMAAACASTDPNFDADSVRTTITMNRISARSVHTVEIYAAFRWWLGLDLKDGEEAPYTYLSEDQLQDPKLDAPYRTRGPALGTFTRTVSAIMYQWSVGRTDKGHLAVVPRGTRVGDVVCIIWGTQTPYMLRKTSQKIGGKHAFELMGCAYVLDYMDGSAADGQHREMFALI